MSNIIAELEAENMKSDVPAFSPGDTVVVQVRVREGSRERLLAFEGVVIGKKAKYVETHTRSIPIQDKPMYNVSV